MLCPVSCTSGVWCSFHSVFSPSSSQKMALKSVFMSVPRLGLIQPTQVSQSPSAVHPSQRPALGINVWTLQGDLNSNRTAFQLDSVGPRTTSIRCSCNNDRVSLLGVWTKRHVWKGKSPVLNPACTSYNSSFLVRKNIIFSQEPRLPGREKKLVLCQHKLSGISNVHV